MQEILTFISAYMGLIVIGTIVSIIFKWLFIRSAVKSGVKQAIIEANEYIKQENNHPSITPEEDFLKEMEGWN